MPRKYERKSSQASWESEAMAEAIKAVKEALKERSIFGKHMGMDFSR
jgi:hypothetical protein